MNLLIRPRTVGAVFRSELLSVLRDRRTMMTGLLVPLLLYPVGGLGVGALVGRSVSQIEAEPSRICLDGAPEDLGPLKAAFSRPTGQSVRLVPCGEAPGGSIDASIEVPPGSGAAMAGDRGADLIIRYSTRDYRGPLARERAEDALRTERQRLVGERLKRAALPDRFAEPIRIAVQDVAPREQSELFKWGPAVIVFLIFFSVLGVFLPSIDVTAGDRERNTLETLLTAPTTRAELVAGKFLVVFSLGLLTTLLNVVSLFATLRMVSGATLQLSFPVNPPVAAAILLATIPTVALAAAVCMAVGCLAKSFRDAQNFLTPVYLALVFPAYAAAMPTAHLTRFTAAIPIYNLPLTMRSILEGHVDPRLVALGALVDIAFATAALLGASRLYGHEAIAFADAEPMSLLRRPEQASLRFTGGEGLSLFAVCAALSFYLGLPLTARGGSVGLFSMQSLCILAPPLAYAVWRRLDWRTAFALRAPGWRSTLAPLLAGLAAWIPVQLFLRYVQEPLFPIPPAVEGALRELIGVGPGWPLMVLLGAAMPALAEELLFRGAVMQSLRPALGRGAVVVSAFLFALMHLDAWRLFPSFLLGLVAGGLVWRTGSLWSGVLFHFTYNLLFILSATFAKHGPAGEVGGPPVWTLLLALLALGATWRLLQPPSKPPRARLASPGQPAISG